MSIQGPGTNGLPLFEPRARNTDPDTSHAAAISMSDAAHSQRGLILAYLKEHGPAIADAIDDALGLRLTSSGRRLPELEEMGLVEMTDGYGTTRSNRSARLWMVR